MRRSNALFFLAGMTVTAVGFLLLSGSLVVQFQPVQSSRSMVLSVPLLGQEDESKGLGSPLSQHELATISTGMALDDHEFHDTNVESALERRDLDLPVTGTEPVPPVPKDNVVPPVKDTSSSAPGVVKAATSSTIDVAKDATTSSTDLAKNTTSSAIDVAKSADSPLANSTASLALSGGTTGESAPDPPPPTLGNQCESECVIEYLRSMALVSTQAHKNVQVALCGRHLTDRVIKKSDHPLIIGAGQGSSSTKSAATMTAALGLSALQYDRVMVSGNATSVGRAWPSKDIKMMISQMRNARDGDCHSASTRFDFSPLHSIDAVYDAPFPEFLPELLQSFPNASVVLTVRNPADWTQLRRRHPNGHMPYMHPCGDHVRGSTDAQVAASYAATNQYIRCAVPPERLTELNFEKESAAVLWTKLLAVLRKRGTVGQYAYEVAATCDVPNEFAMRCPRAL